MALPPGRFPSTRSPRSEEWTSAAPIGRSASTRSGEGDEWTVSAPPDAVIAELARRQHGIVSYAQLLAAGLSEKAIRHRADRGRIARVHRGVYKVGPLTSPLAEPFAAVLACGPTAVLSHYAAAALHGIGPKRGGPIDVTVTSGKPRPRGVWVHRAQLTAAERTERDGIPLTTAARTLVDVAPAWSRRDLERGVEQAVILGLATEAELQAASAGRRR